MTSIYADTTVLATRVCGSHEKQEAVEEAIGGHVVCTSQYVVEELKCTFLHDAVLLHKLLVTSPTTAEALRRMGESYGRRPGRMQQLLGFCVDPDEELLPRTEAIDRLEELIEIQLMDLFLEPVAARQIVDSTDCTRAGGRPMRAENIYHFKPSCTMKEEPKCRIVQFYEAHVADLQLLVNSPENVDNVHDRFREVLRNVLEDPNSGRGRNCNRVLADAIIVLEAPATAEVCSTNANDFQPICQTLGKIFRDARVQPR